MFKKRRQKHSFIDAQNREVKKDTKIAEIISDIINAGIDNTSNPDKCPRNSGFSIRTPISGGNDTTMNLPWSSPMSGGTTYVSFTNLDTAYNYYAVIQNMDTAQTGTILGIAKQK